MKRSDVVFLTAVGLLAAGIAAATLDEALEWAGWRAGEAPLGSPSSGHPRKVNLREFRRLMERGRLSNHEALHYRKWTPRR